LALLALAFGDFDHQKDGHQADGHGLQLAQPQPFATDLGAATVRAHEPLSLGFEYEPDAPILIQGLHVLIAFSDSKRMIKQTLIHPRQFTIPLSPDTIFPDEPVFLCHFGIMHNAAHAPAALGFTPAQTRAKGQWPFGNRWFY
jgi:hypothetical protein